MAILNMTYSVSGSGPQVPLDGITTLTAASGDAKATINRTDVNDLVVNGVTVNTWASTKLVRKAGSAPSSSSDGTLVLTETTANTYQTNGYEDTGLTNNTIYYYNAFSVGSNGLETASNNVSVTPLGRGWSPTANTLMYFPLTSNAVDVVHGVTLTAQKSTPTYTTVAGAIVPCAYFSSKGFFAKTSSTSYLVTGNNPRTISGWIRLTNSGRLSVACYGTGSSNQMFNLYYNDGTPKFRFTQWGGGSSYGNIQPSMDTWYNVIVTFDGSTIKWYINGDLDGSWSKTLNTSNSRMYLGGDMSETGSATPNTGMQGYISEVIFENIAWSSTDVTNYYNTYKSNYGL